jgi:hypothetical protein
VAFPDAGPGDSTGAVEVDPGSHVVGEEAGTATDLADYSVSVACENEAGEPVPVVVVPDGADEVLRSVIVGEGEHVVCTVTNRARALYDGGDTDTDPFENPFGEGAGTGEDLVTTAGPSAPSAATGDPGVDVAGEQLSTQPVGDVLPSAGGQMVDTGPLAMAELPRTGLPLAPQVLSALALIALGQAARSSGRRRQS